MNLKTILCLHATSVVNVPFSLWPDQFITHFFEPYIISIIRIVSIILFLEYEPCNAVKLSFYFT